MSSPLIVAVSTTLPILLNVHPDQAPARKENTALREAKKIIENYLSTERDGRTINELIYDTFEKLNERDTKKFNEFQDVATRRQGAIKELGELKNLIQTQVQSAEINLEANFALEKTSPMSATGMKTATIRQVMEFYRTGHSELGLSLPPATVGQLENYSEMLSRALTNVLAVASQQDMFELQDHMQHMHAMRDLQSALLKSMGDATGLAIKGM